MIMNEINPRSEGAARILIVEDEKTLMDIYSLVLGKAGYEVIKATDGVAGLEAAIHGSPDVVLLDLALPLKNGFEVLRDLRRNPQTAATPVVIISNLAQDYEVKTGLSLGADRFLVKTEINPDKLPGEIAAILSKKAPGSRTGGEGSN